MKILIFGATSAIAEAAAREWACRGERIYVVGRNGERLETIARDLALRGGDIAGSKTFDLNDLEGHKAVIEEAIATLGGIDAVLIAHGTLSDQRQCERDPILVAQEMATNAVSAMSLLMHLATIFEQQKQGAIAVISSVAGDRGRQSNYVYGSAKGALSIFLQGLRQRLSKSNVAVVTVKPGFVDTPMTANFKKGALWAQPEKIGAIIVKSLEKGRGEVYAPGFWAGIMFIIRMIPDPIFRRLKL